MAGKGLRQRPRPRGTRPPRAGDELAPLGGGARRAGARIAILGAGALGSALAASLSSAREVRLWSHTAARARSAARRAGVRAEPDLGRAVDAADLVLVCIRDATLPALVSELAALVLAPRARVVLHTSGVLGAGILAPLARAGLGTGALHPLVPVPRLAPKGVFRGAAFALEAEAPAVRAVARALVRELGGESFELSGSVRDRARYHAAATLVSNGTLALYDVALGQVLPVSLRRPEVRRGFGELLLRTAANLARTRTSAEALTGPVARGDVATVRGHLQRLAGAPAARDLYRRLALELLRIAGDDARLSRAEVRALTQLLAASSGRASKPKGRARGSGTRG